MRLKFSILRRAALVAALTVPAVAFTTAKIEAATPAKVQAVAIKGFAFTPQVVTVAPGTTVTWTNVDEDPHTVTANDKSFHSAALDTDDKFTFTFTKPGEYAYFCSLHPHMTGKIVVKAG
ncbi:amicyanin [Caulobacter sp. CCUG 60055]|uniref:cupredoxin domain-containing protein n=1 Tax=Caulobacter sp. CCUG 60055 TaxID=2100090 RepID=UPI001FA6BC4C|nr:cupredoxin family copper-binding protein [Caulobacter sp. CCUG 60055]MCI3179953.1 amicyanin [Caulobacter sp. CCUG 60055]